MKVFKPGLCVVAFALLSSACNHQKETADSPTRIHHPDKSVELHGDSAAYVRVQPAAAADETAEHALVARVAFDDRKVAMMGPPVQGRVASVNVITGDRVKKGDLLVTLRAPDIAAASAALTQAKTARALAERNAERAKLLIEQGAGSEAERISATAAVDQARAEQDRAEAALAALGGSHGANEFQLRSPIDGIVVERNVAVGAEVHVDQDKPLLVVADLSTVWVTADVYEQDLARVRVGDKAEVQVTAFPGRNFSGKITDIGSTVDAQTRVATARIEIANADLVLRPGMFANVHVDSRAEGVAKVPTSAVLARRDQYFVFLRTADGKFVQREVRPGDQHGEHVAILSGIVPGDPIVTEGAILLDAEANETL